MRAAAPEAGTRRVPRWQDRRPPQKLVPRSQPRTPSVPTPRLTGSARRGEGRGRATHSRTSVRGRVLLVIARATITRRLGRRRGPPGGGRTGLGAELGSWRSETYQEVMVADQRRVAELTWIFRPAATRPGDVQALAGGKVHTTGPVGPDGETEVVLQDGTHLPATPAKSLQSSSQRRVALLGRGPCGTRRSPQRWKRRVRRRGAAAPRNGPAGHTPGSLRRSVDVPEITGVAAPTLTQTVRAHGRGDQPIPCASPSSMEAARFSHRPITVVARVHPRGGRPGGFNARAPHIG